MVAVFIVFIAVVALIVGGFFVAAYVARQVKEERLERRLQEVGPAQELGESTLIREHQEGTIPAVDRIVRSTPVGPRLGTLLEQAGSSMTPGTFVMTSAAVALGAMLVAKFLVPYIAAVALAGLAGAVAPTIVLFQRRTARMRRFEEQFPDALDLLSRAIRAGHAFQSAMGMVAMELPAPVGPEFKRTFEQQNFGLPLREAMNELADRVPLLDVQFFVTAVAIQRESGGNLSEILDSLAHVVRERFKIQRQVRVHTAHGRFTGYVLLGLPAFLAVALSFIAPDQMKLLFYERIGQMMVVGAMVLQTIGFFWIRQVIKIEV